MRILMMLLVLLAVLLAMPASAATPTTVSELGISPTRLYDDDSVLAVSFRTNRPARAGYEWGIFVHITGAYASPATSSCAWTAMSWDAKYGGNPNSRSRSRGVHLRSLVAMRFNEDSYWCRGRAHLEVVEHKIGSGAIGRPLGSGASLDFRVARAP